MRLRCGDLSLDLRLLGSWMPEPDPERRTWQNVELGGLSWRHVAPCLTVTEAHHLLARPRKVARPFALLAGGNPESWAPPPSSRG